MTLASPPGHTYETYEIAEEAVQTFAWKEGYSTKKGRTKADNQGNTRKGWLACVPGGR